MAKAEDLTGREFGYLKVLSRGQDHVSKSGQKKICWICQCKLCGGKKVIPAADLKSGNTISCGKHKAEIANREKHKKICIICQKSFYDPPSNKTVTCSGACRQEYARQRAGNRRKSQEEREKISQKAKSRDLSRLQEIGVQAAKNSPKAGRFETNINAKDWHLISPAGKHYHFHSLNYWLRENCRELFDCEPDTREFLNVRSGLSGAKRAAMGKNYPCCTYKGWQAIPTDKE